MLEQLMITFSDCKQAMDVIAYLERIHIQYLDLIKAKEHLNVPHSRILPKVLSNLGDGRQVGSDSAMSGFAHAVYSSNAFSLGLGDIVAGSISSLERNESRIPDDGEALIDQFGNYADAYLSEANHKL